MTDNHVRKILQRGSRRLMGSRGVSGTLCGAPMTDRDITPQDARADFRKGSWEWLSCEKCRSLIDYDAPRRSER